MWTLTKPEKNGIYAWRVDNFTYGIVRVDGNRVCELSIHPEERIWLNLNVWFEIDYNTEVFYLGEYNVLS